MPIAQIEARWVRLSRCPAWCTHEIRCRNAARVLDEGTHVVNTLEVALPIALDVPDVTAPYRIPISSCLERNPDHE